MHARACLRARSSSFAARVAPELLAWLQLRCAASRQVSEGSGRMLVVAVGPQSEWGKTMALVGEAGDSETPLQERLGWMATSIGKVGPSQAGVA